MSREYKGASRLSRRKKPLLVLFILIIPVLLPNATAHELMDFSMMLKDDGPVPANIGAGIIFEGDGVFFRHVSNNSTTITVAIDNNSDGEYDIQSNNLSKECELDNEGNKTDQMCEVTFRVDFAIGDAGNYSFLVNSSTGESWVGSFVISIDTHVDPGSPIGYSNEQNDEDDDEEIGGEDDSDYLRRSIGNLLLLLGIFCIIFVVVGLVESEETRSGESKVEINQEEE
ncbi:MAG: hypothetical protein HOB52_00785 [Euryarchaeota archaeon]|jgi:hypothetical protein|nr:hypothetical protein [Euryarchaeota archaeon]MBT4406482.1 hypothetical protein [Euryarchaeota archaeon]MBT6644323.1 hypothetical protein [Euryarchaeota archaeon]